MNQILSCFQKYKNVQESYRSHSDFLACRSYYSNLFLLSTTDYKNWASGLQAAGYATDPAYSQKIISLIEQYNLMRFDKAAKF